MAIGEYAEAAGQYKQAYSRTSPKEKELRGRIAFKMGDAYARYGYTARAVGALRNAERYKYTDTLTLRLLGEQLQKQGDYKGAEKALTAYLERFPDDAAAHTVLSAASCTTNCLAPVAKVLNDAFGIRHGLMTTIHSYTMSQRILDGSHKDLRRARAACVSMIPTSTGAAKALALVVPALKGKLDGMAVRVPTPDISLVDLTCELEKPATAEEINAALKAAHDGALHDNMGYCDEPLVSIDFKGSTHGGVVDALSTQVMDGTMAKLIIWYDNESGFTNQLARLLRKVAASL